MAPVRPATADRKVWRVSNGGPARAASPRGASGSSRSASTVSVPSRPTSTPATPQAAWATMPSRGSWAGRLGAAGISGRARRTKSTAAAASWCGRLPTPVGRPMVAGTSRAAALGPGPRPPSLRSPLRTMVPWVRPAPSREAVSVRQEWSRGHRMGKSPRRARAVRCRRRPVGPARRLGAGPVHGRAGPGRGAGGPHRRGGHRGHGDGVGRLDGGAGGPPRPPGVEPHGGPGGGAGGPGAGRVGGGRRRCRPGRAGRAWPPWWSRRWRRRWPWPRRPPTPS